MLDKLPPEIQRKLLSQMDIDPMLNCCLTCKTMHGLNFTRFLTPIVLEGHYNVRDKPSIKERTFMYRLMNECYEMFYDKYNISPFVSLCKDMSCEIDKILGCGGGNRYFRPSFCNIQNAHGFLSNRYIKFDRLNPDITLRRRVRICNDDFLYGYLF